MSQMRRLEAWSGGRKRRYKRWSGLRFCAAGVRIGLVDAMDVDTAIFNFYAKKGETVPANVRSNSMIFWKDGEVIDVYLMEM